MLIQSSTASIALLQQLYDQGAMELNAALSVLIGDNIGTTITAVFAAIGASIAAKRAAFTHVIFNLIGAVLVLLLFIPFTSLIQFLEVQLSLNKPMTIAFAHGFYNVSNTLVQLPFVAILALIVTKLIPGEEITVDYKTKHLDPRFIGSSPAIALGQAKQEVLRMADFSQNALVEVSEYMMKGEKKECGTGNAIRRSDKQSRSKNH